MSTPSDAPRIALSGPGLKEPITVNQQLVPGKRALGSLQGGKGAVASLPGVN